MFAGVGKHAANSQGEADLDSDFTRGRAGNNIRGDDEAWGGGAKRLRYTDS